MQTTNCNESSIFLTFINFAFLGGEGEENNKSKSILDLAGSKLRIFDTERPCLTSRPIYNQPYIKMNLTLRVSGSGTVSHTSILSENCPLSVHAFLILSFDMSE
jgi:hypothetical protein